MSNSDRLISVSNLFKKNSGIIDESIYKLNIIEKINPPDTTSVLVPRFLFNYNNINNNYKSKELIDLDSSNILNIFNIPIINNKLTFYTYDDESTTKSIIDILLNECPYLFICLTKDYESNNGIIRIVLSNFNYECSRYYAELWNNGVLVPHNFCNYINEISNDENNNLFYEIDITLNSIDVTSITANESLSIILNKLKSLSIDDITTCSYYNSTTNFNNYSVIISNTTPIYIEGQAPEE